MCIYTGVYVLLLFYRYQNIIPYNMNRVKLRVPINGCNYVNASWITEEAGYQNMPGGHISFLASQGPMLNTCPHHLQMIYENNVDIIVMLTKIREMKKGGNSVYVWLILVDAYTLAYLRLLTNRLFIFSGFFLHFIIH